MPSTRPARGPLSSRPPANIISTLAPSTAHALTVRFDDAHHQSRRPQRMASQKALVMADIVDASMPHVLTPMVANQLATECSHPVMQQSATHSALHGAIT